MYIIAIHKKIETVIECVISNLLQFIWGKILVNCKGNFFVIRIYIFAYFYTHDLGMCIYFLFLCLELMSRMIHFIIKKIRYIYKIAGKYTNLMYIINPSIRERIKYFYFSDSYIQILNYLLFSDCFLYFISNVCPSNCIDEIN